MKRFLWLVVLSCFIITGCVTTESIRRTNREKVVRLSVGMSKAEALALMGTEPITDTDWWASGQRTTINNPYRSEILQGKDKTLEVLYYYTDVQTHDGVITDDELTPLIFEDGILRGWGWRFLNEDVKRYDIQIKVK